MPANRQVYCPAALATQFNVFDPAVAPIETLMLLKSAAEYPICHSRLATWLPELENEIGKDTLAPRDTDPAASDKVAPKTPACPAKSALKMKRIGLNFSFPDFIGKTRHTGCNRLQNGFIG